MIKNNYINTHFVSSEISAIQCNNSITKEVAFVGYSNCGKSSAINLLTNQKKLARTSKTPGRTQYINFFSISHDNFLVDLPGYGYANVAKFLKNKWEHMIFNYLKKRTCLKGIILFMDIRHNMKMLDRKVLKIALNNNIPVLILLTKIDKILLNDQKIEFNKVNREILKYSSKLFYVNVFSAVKKIGVNTLRQKLDNWLYSKE
ncbi:ribosome biogenesis GTP-binding protein YihA/YsxC [Buchnera aphidicola]|uniref:ribosome biogenesis GTP-binding protein YihA/YsxC n=1 Tax=Buchnera aphidicola TaxID=9 RepID=UPI0031B83518